MPSHKLPSLSERIDSAPVGEPFFGSGTGYSVTLPVLGSSFPRVCSPKLEYQAMPSPSTITSWGSPFGRGKVLSGNCQVEDELKLIELNHSACARCTRACSSPTNAVSRAPSLSC